MHDEILKRPEQCEIILCGDYNARTKNIPDFDLDEIPGSDGDLIHTMPHELHTKQQKIQILYENGLLGRYSQDGTVNSRGIQLMDLCKLSGLLMVNGRCGKDKGVGKFTRRGTTGKSVVDYVFVTPDILTKYLSNFDIHPGFPESDHLPVTLSIKSDISMVKGTRQDRQSEIWSSCYKYVWYPADLTELMKTLKDQNSEYYLGQFRDSIVSLKSVELVAERYNQYLMQACDRVCKLTKVRNRPRAMGPGWFDRDCRLKRSEAVTACRYNSANVTLTCKEYRSLKQMKKRQYQRKCIADLENAFESNPGNMWDTLDKIRGNSIPLHSGPNPDELFDYFKALSTYDDATFNQDYEMHAVNFLHQYDNGHVNGIENNPLSSYILNRAFTSEEIEISINKLKNNKAPGCDYIPAEFIKHCKSIINEDIVTMLNYILEKREFPNIWAEGTKSAVYKSGCKQDPGNYRGITVLSVFAKIFEMCAHDRMMYVNEAFGKLDNFNGGFLKGYRTTDNIFILHTLIQRQVILGKKLYICFVDFTKAFDLVNRHILFFKIIKSGFHGRLIDTLRNMYAKTGYRLKSNGKLSPKISTTRGVNQGGCASDILFRRYLADLSEYLTCHSGVCLGEMIVLHMLWADDLILVTETIKDMQRQLDGLATFGEKNQAIVNDIKTKIMGINTGDEEITVYFRGKQIEQVTKYKYVGNVMSQINNIRGDVFCNNYAYLCNKAKGATYAMLRKVRSLGNIPPKLMLYLFDTMVKPILLYGSDIWGVQQKGTEAIDRVFLWFLKWVLRVKTNTCNTIVYGEMGCVPLRIHCHVNVISYYVRIYNMPDSRLVKQAFNSLYSLTEQGFATWITKVWELARIYDIDLHHNNYSKDQFKQYCKQQIRQNYISDWSETLRNIETHPILRLYTTVKNDLSMEAYLHHVKDFRYRNAITKLRASSHNLEIERGRHSKPKIPVQGRLCMICKRLEDEEHFLMSCTINHIARDIFFSKISTIDPCFTALDNSEKFRYLMTNKSPTTLVLLGKFIYRSFSERENMLKSM